MRKKRYISYIILLLLRYIKFFIPLISDLWKITLTVDIGIIITYFNVPYVAFVNCFPDIFCHNIRP